MKKNYLKKISYAFLALFLLLNSCQVEDESRQTINSQINKLPYLTSKVNYRKLEENKVLINKLNSIEDLNNNYSTSATSKIIYVPQYEFYIDTDESNYVESLDGNYHSYTFPIIFANEQENNKVNNLVLSYNQDINDYEAFFFTYELTSEEKEKIINREYVELQGKTKFRTIKNFDVSIINSLHAVIDQDTGEVTCWENVYGTNTNGWEYVVIGFTQVDCNWASGPSEDGSTSGGSSGGGGAPSGNTGNTGNPTVGGGGGGGGATSPYVMSPDKIRKKEFTRNLLLNNSTAFNWFSLQNTSTQNDILNYLEDSLNNNGLMLSEYSQDAIDFVIDFINNGIDSGLNLNFKKSLKSPANVDITAIDPTSTEGKIFDCVFDKLSKSPKFKNLYNAIFNDTNKINVKFEIADLNSITKAGDTQPTYSYVGSQITGIKNTIRINSYTLNNNSTLYVANAIIHEMLHAYLNVQQIGLGTDIYSLSNYNTLGDILVQDANNTINIVTSNATTNSHAFMFDYMIPAFTDIYNEILNELATPYDLSYEGADITNPATGEFYESWNTQNMLYYLSTGGLDKDKNDVPNSNYMNEIGNLINKRTARDRYITDVKNFNKICN